MTLDERAALERISTFDGYEVLFDPELCLARLREAAAIARRLIGGRQGCGDSESRAVTTSRAT